MKILFVAKRYYTNKDLITDRFGRLYHLPKALALRGHQVWVIALDYKTFDSVDLEENGIRLLSIPSRSRGFRFPSQALREMKKSNFAADIVIGSGHLHLATQARRYARKTGAAFIFEAYDYYPAFLPAFLKSIGVRWFSNLCRNSDGCVAASERLSASMKQINPRTSRIENGIDPQVFAKKSRGEAVQELGLDISNRHICFIGSATESLGFGDFLEALDIIRLRNPEVYALHAGYLDTAYEEHPGLRSFGQCRQETVVTILNASECGVVPYRNSLQVKYSNSCKLVEYMACGLPVVATRSGDNERILGPAYPGLVEPQNPAALAAGISGQLLHPTEPSYPERWTWVSLGESLESFIGQTLRHFRVKGE
jgi:glycosyltransferase involved in cell wall biosynthesis